MVAMTHSDQYSLQYPQHPSDDWSLPSLTPPPFYPGDPPPYSPIHSAEKSHHHRLNIAHPYARLYAKKEGAKRRKIWNHALEKSLFTPHELFVVFSLLLLVR